MRRMMWFGTRGRERWVPCPAINPDYNRIGFEASSDYLSGGVGVRASKNAHNSYVLAWSAAKTRDAIRPITDFADGVYDDIDGVNHIFWIDPMAAEYNVAPQLWATPALGSEDADPLISDAYGYERPTAVATPANTHGYPARSAQFTQHADSVLGSLYIPIPDGYSAWVGVHASASGRVKVQRVNGYTNVGSAVTPTALGVTTATRVNTEFSSADSSGIVIGFTTVGSDTTWTLYALMVQILPTGASPAEGDFISGQGHAGCQFRGKPQKTPLSARLDRVALAATLEETAVPL